MQVRFYLAASAAALSVASVFPTPAFAQETTSSVRGTVESDTGPVAGAAVTVIHEPSGTTATSTTDAAGNFGASGLRIGGPFTVTVQAEGYESTQVTELSLSAGQAYRLPIVLQAQQEIVVTASGLQGAIQKSTGPITALDRQDIEGVATINRDIRDLARRDPLVTIDLSNSRTIEVAGNNGRLNRFSVDGVQFSDDFGLNNGGLPSNRGPVPIDAIEQFSVKVAPYDVSEGDFQGGAINVVLRSGGNNFRGSAFYSYTDDSLTGSNVRGTPVNLDFDSKQYGAHLSGPIIRDKLFFALTYEKTKESDPFDNGVGTGFSAQVPGVTIAQIDNVSAIAQSAYSYDTLGLTSNALEEDEKFVAKLDWNITDGQRASVTYVRNVGNQQFQQNTSLSATSPSIGLLSNAYELTEEINSGVFQLNSQWSDKFSTEVRVSYRDYNRGQIPFGGNDFGQFSVCLDPTTTGSLTACSPGVALVVFGPDVFRHSNALNQENLSADFTARLEAGDHSFKLLAGFTDISTFNLFVPRSLGQFYFDSIADFQARRASSLSLANAVPSLDPDDGAATFSTQAWTFGIQDDWQLTDTLVVTAGVRYDLYNNPVAPALNPNFTARQGFSNRATFSGRGAFQPRFGFNWEATDRIVVRGGVGIFAGGTPDVFLSNSFSNTGQLTNQINLFRNTSAAGCNVTDPAAAAICSGGLIGVDGRTFAPAVTDFLGRNTASLALAPVNMIDPDLNIAKKLRGSLGVDYDADLGFFGDGWLFGVQVLYDETINAYQWTDLRSRDTSSVLPDGRPRYNALTVGDNNQDLLLTNSKDGRAIIGSIRFEKRFDFGLTIDGSYTRSDVTDANALTSSTASSLYSNNAFLDPNFAATGTSIYEIRDQYKFSFDFRRAFFGDYETRFSLFGEYRSGRPYSITVGDLAGGRSPVFGTVGNNGRFLTYIPNVSDPLVSFDSAASEAAFNAVVASEGLGKYRGRIIPKNTQRSPDFFRIDLHVEQEIPTFVGTSRIKLFADVENVLNLIDSDWGALRQVGFPQTAQIASVQCLTTATATGTAPAAGVVNTSPAAACAQYRYSGVRAPIFGTVTRQSLYGIRVGVKFEF